MPILVWRITQRIFLNESQSIKPAVIKLGFYDSSVVEISNQVIERWNIFTKPYSLSVKISSNTIQLIPSFLHCHHGNVDRFYVQWRGEYERPTIANWYRLQFRFLHSLKRLTYLVKRKPNTCHKTHSSKSWQHLLRIDTTICRVGEILGENAQVHTFVSLLFWRWM